MILDKQDASEYLANIINKPWTQEGRHCWRLVTEVQRDLFGRDLPSVLVVAPVGGGDARRVKAELFGGHPERDNWLRVDHPEHGCLVLMRRSAAPENFYIHAGVWLAFDAGGVLHTDNPHGVVFDSLLELSMRGWVPTFMIPR